LFALSAEFFLLAAAAANQAEKNKDEGTRDDNNWRLARNWNSASVSVCVDG
jgi:hypothetical protein